MRLFDYSFLKNQIPGQIVSISNVISDLKDQIGFLEAFNGKQTDSVAAFKS